MSRPVTIALTDGANDDWRELTPNQRDQVRRLVRSLALSPQAGWFWAEDLQGRSLFVVSASDTHLVYTLRYMRRADMILVVAILCFPLPSIHEYEERQRA